MSEPLYMRVDQELIGPRELIVQTLNELAQALQSEVDRRKSHAGPVASAIDESSFLNVVSTQFTRLAKMFSDAGPAFQKSVSSAGSPQIYVDTYGGILDDLRAADEAIRNINPPPAFERTAEAYRGLVRAIYDQVSSWPQNMREAAQHVKSVSYHLKLEVNVKHAPFERAFEADKRALGI